MYLYYAPKPIDSPWKSFMGTSTNRNRPPGSRRRGFHRGIRRRKRLRFLTISTPLKKEKMHRPVLKSKKYLIHGWIPASTGHGHVITCWYPLVEILLSLATQFYSRPLWKVSQIRPQVCLFLLSRIFGMITDNLNLQAYAIERRMDWSVVLVSFSSLRPSFLHKLTTLTARSWMCGLVA
jgi:hypothetical protein